MRNFLRLLCLTLALGTIGSPLVTPAVSGEPISSWPQARYDATRASYNPDEVVMNARAVRRARPITRIPFDWRVGSVLADEGDLFVQWGPAFEGADPWEASISRFHMDGSEVWTDGAGNDSFAIANGRVSVRGVGPFSGCGSSSVHTTDGDALWSSTTEATWSIDATTVFTFDQLYDEEHDWCGSSNVRARDAQTGEERWNVPTGAGVVTDAGVAYVGGEDGILRALDEATGAELWRFERPGRRTFPVASGDGLLYVVNRPPDLGREALIAFDETTHQVTWRVQLHGSLYGLSLTEGRVFISSVTRVMALRTSDGAEVWHTTVPGSVYELRGAAGVIYASQYTESEWIAIRARDGSTIRTFTVEDLIVANGRLITKVGRNVTIWGPPGS